MGKYQNTEMVLLDAFKSSHSITTEKKKGNFIILKKILKFILLKCPMKIKVDELRSPLNINTK